MYVVVSRVRTLNGLFMRRQIDPKHLEKYNEIPVDLKAMIADFRERFLHRPLSEEDYQRLLGHEDYRDLRAQSRRH